MRFSGDESTPDAPGRTSSPVMKWPSSRIRIRGKSSFRGSDSSRSGRAAGLDRLIHIAAVPPKSFRAGDFPWPGRGAEKTGFRRGVRSIDAERSAAGLSRAEGPRDASANDSYFRPTGRTDLRRGNHSLQTNVLQRVPVTPCNRHCCKEWAEPRWGLPVARRSRPP
jgi:hypothetical protein